MRNVTMALLGAAALAACQHDDPPPTYSCDQSAVAGYMTCVEHGPLDDYGRGYGEWYCTSSGGTWGTAPCPTANRVACCEMGEYMGYGTQCWYAGYQGSVSELASGCTMYGGRWITYP